MSAVLQLHLSNEIGGKLWEGESFQVMALQKFHKSNLGSEQAKTTKQSFLSFMSTRFCH
jgi:hypothetical protein